MPLACHQIRIDDTDVAELRGARSVVKLPRHEVIRLRLRHGFVAERPLVQGIFGLGMLVPLAYLLLHLQGSRGASVGESGLLARMFVMVVFATIAAPFVLRGAVERGYVLVVETRRTTRKLGFGRKATGAEVQRFVEEARAAGAEIRVETSLRM